MTKTVEVKYKNKTQLENITCLNDEELNRLTKIFGTYEFIGLTKKFHTPVYVSETRKATWNGQPTEVNDFIFRLEGDLPNKIWNVVVCYNHHDQILQVPQ